MSVEDDGSSSSTSEDELEISEDFEKSFFKTLSSLKNKDPSIYDKGKKFFDDTVISASNKGNKTNKIEPEGKPFYLKDYERKCLSENGGYEEDENVNRPVDNNSGSVPYTVEQRRLKESFKSFFNDSDDEGNEGLLKPSTKSQQEKVKEESDYIQWLKGQKEDLQDKSTEDNLKKLRDYWNSDNIGQDEVYLRDYILNKRFLDKGESDGDEDDGNLTEESETLEAQEDFEQKYNFRYENEDALLRRFPRNVDNSLRRKDNKRSKKRVEVKERKGVEKKKKRDEINRQKKIKCKEISERLEKLKELTGNEKLAFNDDDIINDFDPEEYDRKMSEMYNEEFYHVEDEEKPRIDDLDLNDIQEEIINDAGDIVYDDQYPEQKSSKKNKKKTRTERKKERKKKTFSDLSAIEKPIFDPKLHESYENYMNEYYQLDCEDFIEDIPCRFKYKQVQANDYGLTIEEILAADDKELNRWSSMKKIYKIRSNHVEKNEAKMYKVKGQNEMLKKKILPSLYKQEEENDIENEEEQGHDKKKKKKSKKNNKISDVHDENEVETPCDTENPIEEENLVDLNEETSKTSNSDQNNKNENKKKKRKRDSTESSANTSTNINERDLCDETKSLNITESPIAGSSKQNHNHHENDSSHKPQFQNKFKKGYKFKKKNHDFHESRLAAYGLNPKKFRVKE